VQRSETPSSPLPATLAADWRDLDFPPELGDGVTYARGMHGRPLEYYLARVEQLALPRGRVLDAGCGSGTWSFALRAHADHVHGVDMNAPRVGVAEWIRREYRVTGVSFEVGDVLALDLPTPLYDAVFCYGVMISYLAPRDAFTAFRSQVRDGGLLYVCLNGLGWQYYLKDERGAREDNVADMGRKGLYNTLCSRALLPADWAGDAELAGLADGLEAGSAESVQRLGDVIGRPLSELVTTIAAECGPEYEETLYRDMAAMVAGRADRPSHSRAGRGYDPDEISPELEAAGFELIEWADEGRLARNGREPMVEPIFPNRVRGELRVWEFVARAV
jgi:SAM-dependent methyltransferase